MTRGIVATWVGFLDSAMWRRVGGSSAGQRLLRSSSFRTADNVRRYAETRLRSTRDPAAFSSVRTFCLFLGTVKSGGTLVGSLLDAHPRIVLADEADALRYVTAGFGRDQLFHVLAKSSRREAMKGRVTARRLEPYSLAVPGQWQGRTLSPEVIGDSRAGPTTRLLGERPELVDQLRRLLGGVDDRYVHVVRSPYDPISAMVLRGRRSFAGALEDYEAQCRRLVTLRRRLGPKLLTVRYEAVLGDPTAQLQHVCRFLGVDTDGEYLAACARIIRPSRRGERRQVQWPASTLAEVERIIESFDFLGGYAFEDEHRLTP